MEGAAQALDGDLSVDYSLLVLFHDVHDTLAIREEVGASRSSEG
jgi:hypothetical protein